MVTMCAVDHITDSDLIDLLGGTGAVATLCGGISSQAVSKWRRTAIPKPWKAFLELKRPDVFSRLAKPEPVQ